MGKALNLALIGADEPLGEALLRVLEEAGPEPASCWPVSLEPEAAGTVAFAGEDLALLGLDDLDWERVNAIVLASPSTDSVALHAQARSRNIPLLGPDAYLARLDDPVPGVTRVSDAPAIALSRLLAPLQARGLDSAHAYVSLPMAALGKNGVDELVEQTRSLFALQSVDPAALPVRIAFNLLPVSTGAGLEREALLRARLSAGLPGVAIQVSCVWTPVFHGGAAVLHARVRDPVSLSQLRELWGDQSGVTVMDEPLPGGVPTPATEAVDSEEVFIGRLEVDAAVPGRLSCWLCFDHPRLEAVRIARALAGLNEKAIESPGIKVIT